MRLNGELDTGVMEIPATVYPSMFDREFQATINFRGREITVIVSSDDVVLDQTPSEAGVKGKLRIFLVGVDEAGVLIDLPGEPLGTSRRLRIPSREIGQAFASV